MLRRYSPQFTNRTAGRILAFGIWGSSIVMKRPQPQKVQGGTSLDKQVRAGASRRLHHCCDTLFA